MLHGIVAILPLVKQGEANVEVNIGRERFKTFPYVHLLRID